jgi:acetoacetyl-CoA synthetase
VAAFDEDGRSVVGEQGELVVTQPMPSMPVGFWGDADGSRYRAAYFEQFPGVWRHGDWVTVSERGSCVITGRSDATLNRGGVLAPRDLPRRRGDQASSTTRHPPGSADAPIRTLVVRRARRRRAADEGRHGASAARSGDLHAMPDEVVQVSCDPDDAQRQKLELPVKKILLGRRSGGRQPPCVEGSGGARDRGTGGGAAHDDVSAGFVTYETLTSLRRLRSFL